MSDGEFERTAPPRDILITEDARPLYEELQTDSSSPFEDAQLKDIFVFAMALGFDQGLRTPLDQSRALANRESLTPDQKWVLKSIAVKETESPDVLEDGRQLFKIATEYANGGIQQLHEILVRPGDTFSELSSEIINLGMERFDQLEG